MQRGGAGAAVGLNPDHILLSLGPASKAWLLFPARNVRRFLKILLTKSSIIEGDVAVDKQAGILSKEFGSAQGDRTRDEMNISFSVQYADL